MSSLSVLDSASSDLPAPESHGNPGSLARWCCEFLSGIDLEAKLHPVSPPDPAKETAWRGSALPVRILRPGRPRELRVTVKSPRTPGSGALVDPRKRALLVHAFLHHELQAAELFAWGFLAFPLSPRAFRSGLVRLCQQELGHLALYERELVRLGANVGDFPVRDWFWERVPLCERPEQFVALLGLGLEGANLEYCERFAAAFRKAGDESVARVLERIEHEEIGHVAFAVRWFHHFTGGLDFDRWAAELPAPLTPSLLRGRPLNARARLEAGMGAEFLARLAAAPATTCKSTNLRQDAS